MPGCTSLTPTPSPTPTPAVRVITAARVPAAPTVGGWPWAARTWPASALAGLLAEAGAVGAVVANADGRVHAWMADGAWWLGEGPAGWTWDAAVQVWRRGDAAFLPDVLLPGGWDAAAGRAVATGAAEMVWLWQDGDGAYRIAALYPAGAVRPEDLAAAGVAVALADGRVLYLAGARVEALAPGEALVRDEAGDLLKVLADGSRYRRVTAWGNVRSAAELHQAGAFAGPLAEQPAVPYAPQGWEKEGSRYAFDPRANRAELLDGRNRPLARAAFDEEGQRWVWEKAEAKLVLAPANLSLEQARRFIAGGEYLAPEEFVSRFAGRVYAFSPGSVPAGDASALPAPEPVVAGEKGVGTITVLLSREALRYLQETGIPLAESAWARVIAAAMEDPALQKFFDPKEPFFVVEPKPQQVLTDKGEVVMDMPSVTVVPKPPIFLHVERGEPVAMILADENDALSSYSSRFGVPAFVGALQGDEVVFTGRPIAQDRDKALEAIYRGSIRFHDQRSQLVCDDGYQAQFVLRLTASGQYDWRPVLPHERKNGEYELLTPEQRMRKAMADLSDVIGYDGSGLWERRPNTMVDYTDTQGRRRRQELEVHFVHADQTPSSPVVYEVLKDPATGEMMFTIRQARDNAQNIKGLNEQQAALVRQAWAYLVAADPVVMQKFWRVNKVAGVVVDSSLSILSTHKLEDSFGLIIFNPNRLAAWRNELAVMTEILLTESYELYSGEQFSPVSHDNWRYTGERPPDCLDENAIADAAKRVIKWHDKFGPALPSEISKEARSISQGWLDGLKQFPCQPQIPFEP